MAINYLGISHELCVISKTTAINKTGSSRLWFQNRFLIYQFSVISTVLESSNRERAAIDLNEYRSPIVERLPVGKGE
jgi:hypothetical protein